MTFGSGLLNFLDLPTPESRVAPFFALIELSPQTQT